jgi:hypothetical protein
VTHKTPEFKLTSFNCPYCNAFAHIHWFDSWYQHGGWHQTGSHVAICSHCNHISHWLVETKSQDGKAVSGKMIYPSIKAAPMAHPDMPPDILIDYDEARDIAQESPRGSAALLRLCVQKLCKHLGEPGKNINDDIGSLVKKGLPVEIQQALDIVRVIGNNAVHPGELSGEDVQQVATTLFELVNHIVEDRISRPKKLAMLFTSLPQKALAGIANRDGSIA